MHISRLVGFIAAASVLAACSGNNSAGIVSHPAAPGGAQINQKVAHTVVAPGLAGRLAILRGATRPASQGIHPDFAATKPCTYLSDNSTGLVSVYNANLSLAGTIGSANYGWGVLTVNTLTLKKTFVGLNDGSGSLDVYKPCGSKKTGSLTGLADGGAAYGIAGFAGSGAPGYATDWPNNTIEYWATGSGTAAATSDSLMGLSYFLDVDSAGNVWVTGWDPAFSNEQVDKCNATITSCKTMIVIAGGFPGGVQAAKKGVIYVNNQFGVLNSYKCGASCTLTGSFTYNNGTNPLDYTAIALDPATKKTIWGANIYFCGSSSGLCSDAQPQSIPLSTSTLGTPTAGIDNAIALGVARFKPDTP